MRKKSDVSLKIYTTIGIGGVAETMYFPASILELAGLISELNSSKVSFFVMGGGSNLVFSDNIKKHQVIINLSDLNSIQKSIDHENLFVEVQAGVRLQDLVDLCQQYCAKGLTGLNRVPGSVGGALLGNAGAYGCEIGDQVASVEVLMIDNQEPYVKRFERTSDLFSYRSSTFKQIKGIIVSASFVLPILNSNDFKEIEQRYHQIAEKRDSVYPADLKSPGSLFKNIWFADLPEDIQKTIPSEWVVYGKLPAGRLLEEVGAKGLAQGDMSMRSSHANILINKGRGSQQEALTLISDLQERVRNRFSIELQLEVRFVPSDFSEYTHNELQP